MASSKSPLGIVAGKGKLPALLIQACQTEKRPVVALAYSDQTDPETVAGLPHIWLSLGEVGKARAFLAQHKVADVVLAGAFQRPSLLTLKLDWRGMRFIGRVGTRFLGDNHLLTQITEEIEKEGFRVVSAQAILSSLQKPEGPLGTHAPDLSALEDIYFGMRVLNTTSTLDMGQAVVVQQGLILGLEAAEGTDILIQRCGSLQKEGPRGILVKMSKKNQSQLVDLPTIGPQTLHNVIQAGLQGIVFEAHKTLVIDAEQLRTEANRQGVFLFAVLNPEDM